MTSIVVTEAAALYLLQQYEGLFQEEHKTSSSPFVALARDLAQISRLPRNESADLAPAQLHFIRQLEDLIAVKKRVIRVSQAINPDPNNPIVLEAQEALQAAEQDPFLSNYRQFFEQQPKTISEQLQPLVKLYRNKRSTFISKQHHVQMDLDILRGAQIVKTSARPIAAALSRQGPFSEHIQHSTLPPLTFGSDVVPTSHLPPTGTLDELNSLLVGASSALTSKLGRNVLSSATPPASKVRSFALDPAATDIQLNVLYLMTIWPSAARLLAATFIPDGYNHLGSLKPFDWLPWRRSVLYQAQEAFRSMVASGKFFMLSPTDRQREYNSVCYSLLSRTVGHITRHYPEDILAVCYDMNSPVELSRLLYLLVQLMIESDPSATLHVSFLVNTYRVISSGGHSSSEWHQSITPPGGLLLKEDATVDSIYTMVLEVIYSPLYGERPDSNTILEHDDLIITGVQTFVLTDGQNQAYASSATPPPFLKNALLNTYKGLKAFSSDHSVLLQHWFKRLAVNMPTVRFRQLCVAESYFVYKAILNKFTDDALIKAMTEQAITPIQDSLEQFNGDLMRTLEWLLMQENDPTLMDKGIYICLFPGLGRGTSFKPVTVPMIHVYLTLEENDAGEDTLVVKHTFPNNNQIYFEIPQDHPVLVYGSGHVWVSHFINFCSYVEGPESQWDRLRNVAHRNLPPILSFGPILISAPASTTIKRFDPNAPLEGPLRVHPFMRMNAYAGMACARHEIDKWSTDLETATCTACGKEEAFIASLCWGTHPHQRRNFVGQECAAMMKGSSFKTFNGCITQMLRFLQENMGFCPARVTTQQKARKAITRYIYTFNGANFDHWFFLKTLRFWNLPTDVINNGGLLRMQWGNMVWVDFLRLYPFTSLDSISAIFFDSQQPAGLHVPQLRKWKAFPYGLIAKIVEQGHVSHEDLTEPSVWGTKVIDSKNPLPGHQQAINWWLENISTTGCSLQTLIDYCADDTTLLQYCVEYDVLSAATGKRKDRLFDLTHCITRAQAALLFFRQLYLERTLTSPDPAMKTGFPIPNSTDEFTITEIISESYRGGKVSVFHQGGIPPSYLDRAESFKREKGRYPLWEIWDMKSAYPYAMTHEMPVQLESMDTFWNTPSTSYELKKTNLYCASVQYPKGKSGIMIKFAGYSLCPSFIPHLYFDPVANRHRYAMLWGVELIQAQEQGAVITVYAVLNFATEAIFKEFVEEKYAERVAAKDAAMKLIIKLTLNSSYGKMVEDLKAALHHLINTFDLSSIPADLITRIEQIPGPREEGSSLLVHAVDPTRTYMKQIGYVGSYITAFVRSRWCAFADDLALLPDEAGNPCYAAYGDTDSVLGSMPDPTNAKTITFAQKWIHHQNLGMWCPETDHGIDYFVAASKKIKAIHEYQPDQPPFDPVTFSHDKSNSHFTFKGVPNKPLVWQHYTELISQGSVCMNMGLQFKSSYKHGVEKFDTKTRTVSVKNWTVQPPDPDGFLRPHATLEDFIRHLPTNTDASDIEDKS